MRIWAGAAVLIGLVYACVGIFVFGESSLRDLVHWGTRYNGNLLPMWASWSPVRFVLAAGSAVKSIVGMDFWMFQFAQRHLKNGELPAWFAPLVFVFLVALVVVAYRMGKPSKMETGRRFGSSSCTSRICRSISGGKAWSLAGSCCPTFFWRD